MWLDPGVKPPWSHPLVCEMQLWSLDSGTFGSITFPLHVFIYFGNQTWSYLDKRAGDGEARGLDLIESRRRLCTPVSTDDQIHQAPHCSLGRSCSQLAIKFILNYEVIWADNWKHVCPLTQQPHCCTKHCTHCTVVSHLRFLCCNAASCAHITVFIHL